MKATYRIRANELDERFIEGIKTTFGEQEIEIVVSDIDETDYLLQSPANKERLLKAIQNVKRGENLVAISLEDLE
jgi:antitoxin YefM